jgi:hypothetical protein
MTRNLHKVLEPRVQVASIGHPSEETPLMASAHVVSAEFYESSTQANRLESLYDICVTAAICTDSMRLSCRCD